MKRLSSLLALSLAACATTAPTTAPAPASAPVQAAGTTASESPLPKRIHWFRNSAEQRAIYLQTYRLAGERLRHLAAGQPAGSWGVILDADETVLDNSEYQQRRARQGRDWEAESWNAWVRERAAPVLPGALEFTRLVRELGGRVVFVTNRDEKVCPETRENLHRAGVPADAVLCKPEGGSDKNPRFRAVQEGTAPGLPALRVLMYVGDNIRDFPNLSQESREQGDALEPFGRTYWMLPNPMYGSWESVPAR